MPHTFKTGDTGLTRNKYYSFIVMADNLKSERPLAVRFTELATGDEFIGSRYPDGRLYRIEDIDLDLMPPEPKVIGSVWVLLRCDNHSEIFPSQFVFRVREHAVKCLSNWANTPELRQDIIARFDTYDDITVGVKVEKV